MRHRKPGSYVDEPDVDVTRDPLPLEVRGKPSVFVEAQESRAPSGLELDGHDTLGQFLELQRNATQVQAERDAEPLTSAPRLRVLVVRLLLALVLLAAGTVAVLYAHPA